MIKGLVIFGAGVYCGVYIAQTYKDGLMSEFCQRAKEQCDKAKPPKKWLADLLYFFEPGMPFCPDIDKVEDPKALFEKAQAYIKSKLEEFDNGKKGEK